MLPRLGAGAQVSHPLAAFERLSPRKEVCINRIWNAPISFEVMFYLTK
jgi:hypothetical protein